MSTLLFDAAAERKVERLTLLLASIARQYERAVLASSLSAEDMLLTHFIAEKQLTIDVITLDTGRLHAQTLAMIVAVRERYGIDIEVYRPDASAMENYVAQHGENAFYESLELRKACCAIRKVEPLARALAGRDAWVTGQRRAHATTRSDLPIEESDSLHGIAKFNPLAQWSDDDVWRTIRAHGVPYNPLHDRGYPSIGCEPCTRAVRPGEDVRAGRWWWESRDNKECGLHAINFTRP